MKANSRFNPIPQSRSQEGANVPVGIQCMQHSRKLAALIIPALLLLAIFAASAYAISPNSTSGNFTSILQNSPTPSNTQLLHYNVLSNEGTVLPVCKPHTAGVPENCYACIDINSLHVPPAFRTSVGGYCTITESFVTYFPPTSAVTASAVAASATTGAPYLPNPVSELTSATPIPTSPANIVEQYNNQNGPSFITCPMQPTQQSNSQEYVYTGSAPNIAGDACTNNPSKITLAPFQLLTTLILKTPIPSQYAIPDGGGCILQNQLKFKNPGVLGHALLLDPGCWNQLWHTHIGLITVLNPAYIEANAVVYSPSVNGNISDTVGTSFNIFQNPTPQEQQLLWTWSADFAKFSNAPPSITSDSGPIDGIVFYTPADPNLTAYYTYTYDVKTSFSSVENYYIPFNVIAGNFQQPDFNPMLGINQRTVDANVLPFFTLRYTLNSPGGQQLSSSQDVYSPYTYWYPSNYLDPIPINLTSDFYTAYEYGSGSTPSMTYFTTNGFGVNLATDTPPYNAPYNVMVQTPRTSPTQVNGVYFALQNPISMAVSQNGYMYVLTKSTSSGDYYITILKNIREGVSNMTYFPPTTRTYEGCVTSDNPSCTAQTGSAWLSEWEAYWQKTVAIQRNNTIFVNSFDLTNMMSKWGVQNDPVYNISVDSNGDVFAVGGVSSGHGVMVLEVANSLGKKIFTANSILNDPFDSLSRSSSPTEITASPSGNLVFIATPASGYIYAVNTISMSYEGNLSLAFGGNLASGTTGALNIQQWLAGNGLYNASIPWVSDTRYNSNLLTDFDTASFHHPLGIQDINGYLYVLDSWGGIIGQTPTTYLDLTGKHGGILFNILTLRVLNSTGSNVPISPSYKDNMYNQQCPATTGSLPLNQCIEGTPTCPAGCTLEETSGCLWTNLAKFSLSYSQYACVSTSPSPINSGSTFSTLNYGPLPTYPPYGWVLSANITAPENPVDSVTFCSSGRYVSGSQNVCTYYFNPSNPTPAVPQAHTSYDGSYMPANYLGNYYPIGPALSAKSAGYSPYISFSVNANGTAAIYIRSITNSHWFSSDTDTYSQYTELIVTSFSPTNYTKYFNSAGSYQCYITPAYYSDPSSCFDTVHAYPGSDQGKYPTAVDNVLNSMQGPIYYMPNSYEYLAGLGTTSQQLTLSPISSSLYSGGGASGSGAPKVNKACAQTLANTTNNNNCVGQQGANNTASEIESAASAALKINTLQTFANQQVLSSQISTELLIPFTYNYQYTETYSNLERHPSCGNDGALNGMQEAQCEAVFATIDLTQMGPSMQTYSMIAYASSTGPTTGSFSSPIEGGFTYMNYSSNGGSYYIPNLTDQGLTIPPQFLTNLQGDRNITSLYLNISPYSNTILSSGLLSDQFILNASHYFDFKLNSYVQAWEETQLLHSSTTESALFPPFGYMTISTVPVTPPETGPSAYIRDAISIQSMSCLASAACLASSISNGASAGVNYVTNTASAMSYIPAIKPSIVNLFSFYQEFPYTSTIATLFNSSTYSSPGMPASYSGLDNLLGYNRIIYNLQDRFGNIIHIPIDADFANITIIKLNVSPQVSPGNSNQTTLAISGEAGYYTLFGTKFVPMAYQPIYLYYGADTNYVNYNPTSPGMTENAILCTFGSASLASGSLHTPSLSQCELSNPNYAGLTANALVTAYSPSFGLLGSCPPASNSLLATETPDCNIYGTDGSSAIPAACPASPSGSSQYCEPVYSNGTGICTSQLGLISTVPGSTTAVPAYTDKNGAFSATITACGTGTATILAKFYGASALPTIPGKPSEPLTVTQSPLTLAAEPNGINQQAYTYNVLDYVWAPNQTESSTNIGLFELSYGDVSGYLALVAVAFAAMAAYFAGHMNRRSGKRAVSGKRIARRANKGKINA